MLVISRLRAPRFIIQNSDFNVIRVNGVDVAQPVKGKSLNFIPLGAPMQTTALPSRYGRQEALGKLNTDNSRQCKGMDPEEAEAAIFAHPKYGIDFVAIGRDGRAVTSDDQWIEPSAGGNHYCNLCDQQIAARGLHSHLGGAAHVDRLETKEQEALDKMMGTGS